MILTAIRSNPLALRLVHSPPSLRSQILRSFSSATISRKHEDPLFRPSPPPLPRADQREFEELVRQAQTPFASASEEALAMHPDARPPVQPEFDGEVNPTTGEKGGPKREPVKQWTEDGGDWSFKGRVSDF